MGNRSMKQDFILSLILNICLIIFVLFFVKNCKIENTDTINANDLIEINISDDTKNETVHLVKNDIVQKNMHNKINTSNDISDKFEKSVDGNNGVSRRVETKNEVKETVESKMENKNLVSNNQIKQELQAQTSVDNGIIDKGNYYVAEKVDKSKINYSILKKVMPSNDILVENGYDKDLVIKVKMFVSENGDVQNVDILSGENVYGIHNEVIRAMKKWKFSKLSYNGKPLKIYFTYTLKL